MMQRWIMCSVLVIGLSVGLGNLAAPTHHISGTGEMLIASVNEVLGPVSLKEPSYGAERVRQPITYKWYGKSGAKWYEFQLAKDSEFTNIIRFDKNLIETHHTPNYYLRKGTYYWRVRAGNAEGPGAWSSHRKLKILSYETYRPYASDSAWNTPIASSPSIDPKSANMIELFKDTNTGGQILSDTTQYTFTIYFAGINNPQYDIYCVVYKCSVVDANGQPTYVDMLEDVPIPSNAAPSDGDDAQMIIVDVRNGNEYGFYHMRPNSSGGWVADNGYQYNVHYSGMPEKIGARGGGVPYYAGLIRPWEIEKGEIRHAIAFAYPHTNYKKCVFPASQHDGRSDRFFAMPYGARLQLDPNLDREDFDRWGLNRAGRIVARALQRYGMIVVDTSTTPKIYAEDLTHNSYNGQAWDSLGYTKEVIASIPYQSFRVLELPGAFWNTDLQEYLFGDCLKDP